MKMEKRTLFEIKSMRSSLKISRDYWCLLIQSAKVVFLPQDAAGFPDKLNRNSHARHRTKCRTQNFMARNDVLDRRFEMAVLERAFDRRGALRLIRRTRPAL